MAKDHQLFEKCLRYERKTQRKRQKSYKKQSLYAEKKNKKEIVINNIVEIRRDIAPMKGKMGAIIIEYHPGMKDQPWKLKL